MMSSLACLLASDAAFKGIGAVRAQALSDAFGDGLHSALLSCNPDVEDVLGQTVAIDTFAAYAFRSPEIELLAWLDRSGLTNIVGTAASIKVARCWGTAGIPAIQGNPYLLLSVLSWLKVEAVARHLGIPDDDPRRAVAAVEAILLDRLEANHTLTPRKEVEARILRKLDLDPHDTAFASSCVDRAIAGRGGVEFGHGLQPPGAAEMERFIAAEAIRLSRLAPAQDLLSRNGNVTARKHTIRPLRARGTFEYTTRQSDAIDQALQHRMFLLAGYAGSGKTTVLAGICDAAEKMGRHCYLMALSGRAAQRMSEATGRAATTIARFLSRRVGKVQPGLGAHEIVVIDEASMLDLPTLWRILRRIGRASLVLVGDPAQLPPIGFGLTFHSLLQCSALPSVTLDRVLRQRVGTGIPMIAEAARHGTLPNLPPFDAAQPGVFFVDAKPGDAIAALLQTGRQMGATGATPDDMQIISPVRRGPAGIDAINQHLHGLRCAAGGHTHEEVLNLGLCPDDPIIWTKNDPVRNLTNGSMGRVLSVFQSGLVARLDEQEITLQERDLKNVALAYAITVHKAQGSQWPKVLVPVFRSPLLDRTLLYTAITRASEQVVLVGDRQAAMEAILATPKSLTRDTSLPGRLERSRSSMEHSAQV